jgi:hypothetical protein
VDLSENSTPASETENRFPQTYVRIDEVKARGVDCFRAVFKPTMRKFLSVYFQIYASFYFGPGRPNKPVLSMFELRPGLIDQLTGCIDLPCDRKGAMFHGRMIA